MQYGKEAEKMIGRNPCNIEVVRPLKDGVISNYTITIKMLKHFLKKALGKQMLAPRVMICVPSQVTEVEKRSVIDATLGAGAKKVYVIEEPVAAAIGAGIDIAKPSGNLVVDIGGGTTDIAVISIGGAVVSTSIKIAGNKYDQEILKYIKKKYKVLIGEKTAEEIKITIGSAYPRDDDKEMTVRGRNLNTGLPVEITINDKEILNVILPEALKIIETIKATIEKAPPELIEDVSAKGIYMTRTVEA